MTPEELAAIHAACFTQQRPWRAAEFQTLLADKANFLITRGAGFLLGRTVLDEAELMTIAVAPTARRAGLGAALVATFEAEAKARELGLVILDEAGFARLLQTGAADPAP